VVEVDLLARLARITEGCGGAGIFVEPTEQARCRLADFRGWGAPRRAYLKSKEAFAHGVPGADRQYIVSADFFRENEKPGKRKKFNIVTFCGKAFGKLSILIRSTAMRRFNG